MDWPVVDEPVVDVVPDPPGVCWVDPCVGGSRRDGGKISEFERLGVIGPLGRGVRAGAPLPTVPPEVVPGDVAPDPDEDPDPDDVWAIALVAVKPNANSPTIAVRIPCSSS